MENLVMPIVIGIVINLLWLGPLWCFSPGVRALFKDGIQWGNPKTWAIVAGIVFTFCVVLFSLCMCTAIQGEIAPSPSHTSVWPPPARQGP